MKVGILGGSFDPIHNGHIQMASTAHKQCGLDEVWFVPCAQQPLKPHAPAPDMHRLALLCLVLTELPFARLRTDELARGGVSYTVDTVKKFRKDFPNDELYLLLGMDSVHGLDQWHQPEEIFRLCSPIVFARDDKPLPQDILHFRHAPQPPVLCHLECPASSSAIREKIMNDEPLPADWLPPSVANYLDLHELYQKEQHD